MSSGQLAIDNRDTVANVRVWGLTGGIASGKSTVGKYFAEAGIPVIDADQIARELTSEGGKAHPLILQRFGTVDRKRLREIAFADPASRRELESILHPLIQFESLSRMKNLSGPVIYEAALLVETGRYATLHGLIVVEAPLEERVQRLTTRDGIDRELAEKIIAAQLSDRERRSKATHFIVNDGTVGALRGKVLALAPKL